MSRLEQINASIDRKHALLSLKIEALALEDFVGMTKIKLWRLVKEKAKMARKIEA